MLDIYEQLLVVASRIKEICVTEAVVVPAVRPSGIVPTLTVPDPDWFITGDAPSHLPIDICRKLQNAVNQRVCSIRCRMLDEYAKTILSLYDIPIDTPDRDLSIEETCCRLYERLFNRLCRQIKHACLARLIRPLVIPAGGQEARKVSCFTQHALSTLEEAYSHSTVLTTLECRMVAQAAGITHQQVRTWFQNKRNRANRARRNASTSALHEKVAEPVADPRRVISGLPKRAGKVITDEHIDLPVQTPKNDARIRVIRELPKRGIKKALSSDSSSSSLSSIDSTSPPDIFQSPLDATSSRAPVITFPSAEPSAAFTLPSFPPAWSATETTQSPLEAGDMIWSMGETNQTKIQTVLDRGLTLGPSPSFSSMDNVSPVGSGADDSPSEEISLDMLNYDGLDNDEFLSLLSNIVSSSGMGENEDLFSGIEGEDPFAETNFDGMFGEMTGPVGEIESLGSSEGTPSLIGKPSLDSLGSSSNDISMEVIVNSTPVEVGSQEVRPRVDRSPSLEEFLREHSPVIAQASEAKSPKGLSPILIDPALQVLETASAPVPPPLTHALPLYDPSYSAPLPQMVHSQSQQGYPQYQYPAFPIYPAPAQHFYPFQPPQLHHNQLLQASPPLQTDFANGWIPDALPFDNAYAFAQAPAAGPSRKGKWVFVAE